MGASSMGTEFIKHGRRGKPHTRLLKIDIASGMVDWTTGRVCLDECLDIVKGKQTAVFKDKNCATVDDAVCLSILLSDRTLDLQAKSPAERDSWYWLLKGLWEKRILQTSVVPLVLCEEKFSIDLIFSQYMSKRNESCIE